MGCASTQLRTTIDEAREAVWNLRQKPAAVTSLGPLLQSMAEQVGHEFGVPVEFVISGKSFEFQRDTIHELLMVAREAIYNAVRHGRRPSTVQIRIHFEKHECELTIADDGEGFDPKVMFAVPAGHYGLVGTQERIQRIGGRLAVNGQLGVGTEVVMHIRKGASPSPEKSEVQAGL